MPVQFLRGLLLIPLIALMSGCHAIVLSPAGDVAVQQRNLVIASTALMLLIIVPVIVLTLLFAWRYRASNTDPKVVYDPGWHHSTQLELVIWSAPLLIIIALGALTWIGTHTLDPYRPIERLDASRPLPTGHEPLQVQVVAMDWKWLFIYPEQGIASLNELAAPVDVPIRFQITATSVMNAFYVPALAGMIYAMPAMETQLNAVINKTGEFNGFSANYSGRGFSDMHFAFRGMTQEEFDAWVQKVKADGGALRRADYVELEKPSEREPVRHYASVDDGLFRKILNMCVDPSKMCNDEMMAIDRKGGLGMNGVYNVGRLAYDRPRAWGRQATSSGDYVLAMCSNDVAPPLTSPVAAPRAADDAVPASARASD